MVVVIVVGLFFEPYIAMLEIKLWDKIKKIIIAAKQKAVSNKEIKGE